MLDGLLKFEEEIEMRAFSKTGVPIRGTYEVVNACCATREDSFSRNANGSLAFEHDGSGSDVFWDDMRQIVRFGKRVFMDENGTEWTEDQIVLKDDEEETA